MPLPLRPARTLPRGESLPAGAQLATRTNRLSGAGGASAVSGARGRAWGCGRRRRRGGGGEGPSRRPFPRTRPAFFPPAHSARQARGAGRGLGDGSREEGGAAGAWLPALAGLGGHGPPPTEGGARPRLGAHGRAHQRARAAGTRLLPASPRAAGRAQGLRALRHAGASIKGFVVTAPPSRGPGNQVPDRVPRGPPG